VNGPWFPGLILASAMGPASTDMYIAALPNLQRDLGATESLMQASITACIAGMAIGMFLSGPLSDSWGRRGFLLGGGAAYLVASVVCALAPNIWTLDVARLGQGLAAGAAAPMARAILSDTLQGPALRRRLATLTSIFMLAPILAPLLGGGLIVIGGWRATFWAMAATGGAVLLSTVFGISETLPSTERSRSGVRMILRRTTELVSDPEFRWLLIAQCTTVGALFTYVAASAIALRHEYGVQAGLFTIVFATNAVAMALTSLVFRLLVDRVDPARMRLIGLAASTLAVVALLVVVMTGESSLGDEWALLAAALGGFGLAVPAAMVLAQMAAKHNAGTASSLIAGGGYLTAAVAAPLTGAIGVSSITMAALMTAWLLATGAVLAIRASTGRAAMRGTS